MTPEEQKHSTTPQNIPKVELALLAIALLLILAGVGWVFYEKQHFAHTFYPEVYIDGVNMSGKTRSQAEELLQSQDTLHFQNQMITIQADQVSVSSTAAELALAKNYQKSLDQAYSVGHQQFIWDGLLRLLFNRPPKQEFTTQLEANDSKLAEFINTLKAKVDNSSTPASAKLLTSGKVATLKIDPGEDGVEIETTQAQTAILETLRAGGSMVLLTPVTVSAQLSPDEVKAATDRASKLVGKQITFQANDMTENLNDQKMIALLQFPSGLSSRNIKVLADTWNKDINRLPQDAVFEYDKNTLKVSKFVPPQNGLTIHQEDLQTLLVSSISDLENGNDSKKTVTVPVVETAPTIGLSSTNDLGIIQQVGFGESEYFHSIPGRIHNVDLTASRINNTIVKAGDEFSFNKTLGDVSAATGFAPAYVIKNGHTELGDGGGVCQVSTTLFRAVLNAGLPVTKRIAHSYRVSYYELNSKPGIDATVYAGDVDFRFVNDTGHDILVHTENNPKSLYLAIKIYGTSDGRTTEIVDHKTYDPLPAPPNLYQDDPSLPKGTTKQIDFAAAGIKASFTNIVRDKDGKELRRSTFFSNYKPWQAVYLVGTG